MGRRWVDRRFDFTAGVAGFAAVLERLREAPDRAGRLLAALPGELAARRLDGAWSMLDNVGHLADLEELHRARIDQILAGVPVLRPADMSNRKTEAAGHSARPPGEVVGELGRERQAFVAALAGLAPADLERAALHPRLGQPMRLVDLARFVAEHDDHHLVRAAEMAVRLRLGEAPWSEAVPGLRARGADHGGFTLRLLDLAPGFEDPNECRRRHELFVLAGVLELEVGGGRVELPAGRTAWLDQPHRPGSRGGAELVVVDLT